MSWKAQAPAMVRRPIAKTAAGARISRRVAGIMDGGRTGRCSGKPEGEIEQNDGARHPRGDGAEALFDEGLDLGAVAPEQPGEREEAEATGGDRRDDEERQVDVERARQDRDDLDRRQVGKAGGDEEEKHRIGIGRLAELLEILERAPEGEDRLRHRLVGEMAEEPAGNAPEHRGEGGDRRIAPGAVTPRDHHRDEEDVGGDEEDAAFDEGDDGEPKLGRFPPGEAEGPVVKAAQHAARLLKAGDGAGKRVTGLRGRAPRLPPCGGARISPASAANRSLEIRERGWPAGGRYPSPRFSRLPTVAKRNGPPPQGGRKRAPPFR